MRGIANPARCTVLISERIREVAEGKTKHYVRHSK